MSAQPTPLNSFNPLTARSVLPRAGVRVHRWAARAAAVLQALALTVFDLAVRCAAAAGLAMVAVVSAQLAHQLTTTSVTRPRVSRPCRPGLVSNIPSPPQRKEHRCARP